MSLLDKYAKAQESANSVSDASKQTDKYANVVATAKTELTKKASGTGQSIYAPVPGTGTSTNNYVNTAFQASKL
jgi:hypothetical protein